MKCFTMMVIRPNYGSRRWPTADGTKNDAGSVHGAQDANATRQEDATKVSFSFCGIRNRARVAIR